MGTTQAEAVLGAPLVLSEQGDGEEDGSAAVGGGLALPPPEFEYGSTDDGALGRFAASTSRIAHAVHRRGARVAAPLLHSVAHGQTLTVLSAR